MDNGFFSIYRLQEKTVFHNVQEYRYNGYWIKYNYDSNFHALPSSLQVSGILWVPVVSDRTS